MRAQYLDSMDLERERGITIKAQNVRVDWNGHTLHLIDTTGHVDFGYEVSRSLAACEGVVLVVDAAQGIEAQTLANCYLALENDLEIVAVLNKIDLPAADPDRYAQEIENVLGIKASDILRISAKTGLGVPELLDAVCERIPAPSGDPEAPLQALIFDSQYDQYRGVVSSIRVMNGRLTTGARVQFMQAGSQLEAIEIGVRRPVPTPVAELGPGEVGYLIAGIKDVAQARSGETVTIFGKAATEPLPGYSDPKPMVFCGLYPIDGDDFENLRESLEKLKLNDASVTYEPESSGALGFGFRCGFLGLLHMEIVKERLEREFALALIATAPSVEYRVMKTNGEVEKVDNPADLPAPQNIDYIEEPYFRVSIITPKEYTGTLMELCQSRRGDMSKLEYLSPERVELHYVIPLAEGRVFWSEIEQKPLGEVDHEEREANRISDRGRLDIHEILKTPELFGVPEIELDLKAQVIEVNQFVIRQRQIAAKKHDMGPFLGCEICLDNDDHIQHVGKRLGAGRTLIDIGADTIACLAIFQILKREVVVLDFVPINPSTSCGLLRSVIGKVKSGVAA